MYVYLCSLRMFGLFLPHSVASSSSTEPWYTSSDKTCMSIACCTCTSLCDCTPPICIITQGQCRTNLKFDCAWREGLDPNSMKTLIGVVLNVDRGIYNYTAIQTVYTCSNPLYNVMEVQGIDMHTRFKVLNIG